MSRISIKEIKESYLRVKEEEKKFKWTYYVRRPISFYMAWPFMQLGVSANSITVFWLIIGIVGGIFVATGTYTNMIIGTVLFELAIIFDCVDGHVARFGRPSRLGGILDMWSGEILLVSSFFSIGVGLSNTSQDLLGGRILSGLGVDSKVTFLYFGFVGALASLSAWTVRLHWRTITLRSNLVDVEPDKDLRDSRKVLIIDNLFSYSGALTFLMILGAALYFLDVLLVIICIVYILHLSVFMQRVIRRARSLDATLGLETDHRSELADNISDTERDKNEKAAPKTISDEKLRDGAT